MRKARLAARLSLSDLAGPELTRQAVHLIETGKSRPSMRSLRQIADRLGMPVETFLKPQDAEDAAAAESRSAELALLCQTYRYAEAAELTTQILAGNPGDRLRAVAHLYRGQALCQLKQAEEALHHLEQARALAESSGDPGLAAEAIGWQASAHYVVDDPGAVELGEEALRRYREVEPREAQVESQMLERLGTFLLRRGAHQRALRCYQEALAVSGVVQDLVRLARIYQGMGQIEWVLGNRARATELGERAVALYATEREMRPVFGMSALARAENDLGMMLMGQGQLERAEERFRAALDHLAAAGMERLQSHFLLSLAELRQLQGRIGDALGLAEQALGRAERLGEVLPLAAAHQRLGELHCSSGRVQLVDAHFGRALQILETAGLVERHAACLARYRELLEQLESPPDHAPRLVVADGA